MDACVIMSAKGRGKCSKNRCCACTSSCFFEHLTSEATAENRRFFAALPAGRRKPSDAEDGIRFFAALPAENGKYDVEAKWQTSGVT